MKRDLCFFREKKKESSWETEKTTTRWKQEEKQGSVPKQGKIPNNMIKTENKYEDLWGGKRTKNTNIPSPYALSFVSMKG